MAIYSGSGDGGFARLPGPAGNARKDDARFAALGTIDELNATIGLCAAEARRTNRGPICQTLCGVQEDLLRLGAVFAAVSSGGEAPLRLGGGEVERMEKEIDRISAELPELTHFVLPGGCELAARLHAARTVARRAERAAVAALNPTAPGEPRAGARRGGAGQDPGGSQTLPVLTYLNRLSDLLFTLARLANHQAGEGDAVWTP
jgi:cob(I)alamin adenosyltransferase